MTTPDRKILLCSCEGTMSLDPAKVRLGCKGASLTTAQHLCGGELDLFRAQAKDGRLTVACTQQRPLFEEVAEDDGLAAALTFVNVRETAGWSAEGANAAPKMAALLAAATVVSEPATAVTMASEGVTLIYGRDQRALDAAERLKDTLDLTVILLPGADVVPPRQTEYPIRQGRIRTVKGHLGAFEIMIDAFAAPTASSRARLTFGRAQDGAQSRADILIDLSGLPPLIPAAGLREGYLRANPDDAVAVERTLAKASNLTGTFDKQRFITFRDDLCAHSRSRITGCTRCLDLCPAGAITPAGNHVAIDPHICAGCGQCAAACPTGAASTAIPTADVLIARLRAMLTAYRAAGGLAPQLLIHDAEHGDVLIDAAARFGKGLPARTLPFAVNEVTQIGLEYIAAAFAYGSVSLHVLTRAKPRHDIAGLHQTLATANTLLSALGYGAAPANTIATDDPDVLLAELEAADPGGGTQNPATFQATGAKRDVLRLALRELHRAAPAPVDTIALGKGAAFGRVDVRGDGCTLCLACVSACPTHALGDAPDRPRLTFDESLCVQCGLCAGTCPEKVITLEPRLHFPAFEAQPVVIKEEEPFCCTACGKPFGVKSTIERVVRKLEGQHWMFTGEHKSRIDLIGMCEDCRVDAAVNRNIDPFAGPARPAVRTSDDYVREREAKAREAAMLDKIKRGDT